MRSGAEHSLERREVDGAREALAEAREGAAGVVAATGDHERANAEGLALFGQSAVGKARRVRFDGGERGGRVPLRE